MSKKNSMYKKDVTNYVTFFLYFDQKYKNVSKIKLFIYTYKAKYYNHITIILNKRNIAEIMLPL